MPEPIEIYVEGLDEVMEGFDRMPRMVGRQLVIGMEVGIDTVLNTRGLRKYPPATEANRPPTPYYRRGVGMVRSRGIDLTSERLGTQFYAKADIHGREIIGIAGQRASYGHYVVGDKQPHHMADKGWKKMEDVFKLSGRELAQILERYVAYALFQVGLIDDIAAAWR